MPKRIHRRASNTFGKRSLLLRLQHRSSPVGPLSARLSGILPPILCLITTTIYTREPTSYPNVLPSDVPSHSPTHGRRPIKMHSSFLPIRRGFLHRTVSKPPRPPRLCVALQPIPFLRGRARFLIRS